MKNQGNKILNFLKAIKFLALFFILAPLFSFSAVMQSPTYKIEGDSVNVGGTEGSASTNYRLSDTAGEVGTGATGSASYNIYAGYRQMSDVFLSISSGGNISMSPDIPTTGGGAGTGQTTFTVTTDSPSGYVLAIRAATNPALQSGGDSFANYTLAGADPDFAFSVAAAASEFGFTPEGGDVVQKYLDNGSACNVGALNTADRCWNAITTSDDTVASRTSANNPSGTVTTVKLRTEVGASQTQPAGSYTASITLTATAL